MRFVTCVLVSSLVLWVVAGCEKKEDATKAAGAAGDAARSAVDSTKEGAGKITEELSKKVDGVTKEFPQVGDIIEKLKANKPDAADKALAALEAAKATLPAKLQEMLPKLRGVVDKVKGGAQFDVSMLSGVF